MRNSHFLWAGSISRHRLLNFLVRFQKHPRAVHSGGDVGWWLGFLQPTGEWLVSDQCFGHSVSRTHLVVARNASHMALPQPLRAATPGKSPALSSSCLLVSEQDTGQSPWQFAHCFVQFDQLSCPHFPLRSSPGEERQGQDNWILTVVTAKLIELKTLKLNMTLTLS